MRADTNRLWDDRLTYSLERLGRGSFCPGNRLSLLQDGPEVFAAWEQAIGNAKQFILFANYIIHSDGVGMRLATALKAAARRGVKVFVLYDWFGSFGTDLDFWRGLEQQGVIVQRFNPPTLLDPTANFIRYHGKVLCIDGTVGFVGGLCVGDEWMGDKHLGIEPWRDTAIRIEGPAVLSLIQAFKEVSFDLDCSPLNQKDPQADETGLVQMIIGVPSEQRFYRVFNALLSMASSSIWITNAYFSMPRPLYDALIVAAKAHVDVRILLPRHSDIPVLSLWSRSGYQSLLDAGVRIFEWEGSMLHAKSVVVDGVFSAIGSSNLNSISLKHSWEVDALVKDSAFAQKMQHMFLRDQQTSSEIVSLEKFHYVVKSAVDKQPSLDGKKTIPHKWKFRLDTRSYRRKMNMRLEKTKAAVARVGAAVFAGAIQRQFAQSLIPFSFFKAMMLLIIFVAAIWAPWLIGMPVAVISLWLGLIYLGHSIGEGIRRYKKRKNKLNSIDLPD